MKPTGLIAGFVALAALSGNAAAVSAETLEVVASFSILGDVVKQVGGDHVEVKTLVGPGGDGHAFEPSPDHAKRLKAAKLAFISGEGFEGWFGRLAKAAAYKGKPVVVSSGIETLTMDEKGKSVTDPHVWNNPANVVVWVANIEKALAAAAPENAAAFKANAARYSKELQELNAYAHSKMGAVPKEKRKILTSHEALGYFGKEYGVEFLSPLGLSTETEASAADVAKLIDQIKKEKVKVYFIESSNDPRLIKQIADATGAEPGGELYVESLSDTAGPAPTYAKMFRHNVDQIAAAMPGS